MHTIRYTSSNSPGAIVLVLNSVLLCLTGLPARATEVQVDKNQETGLFAWTAIDTGFSLELIQLLPDFVRAIYESHGFPDAEIENIAAYCVFGTIIKNTSQQRLSYRVDEWYYLAGDKTQKRQIKTKSSWLEQWRKAGITFSWTLLPDQGMFEAGDWQQGFTTLKLPRNSTFDLIYSWKLNDKAYSGKIDNLRCAPDEAPLQ